MDALKDYENLALSYLSGENGILANETKAFEMFTKIKKQSKLAKSMLAFIYLKGRGV